MLSISEMMKETLKRKDSSVIKYAPMIDMTAAGFYDKMKKDKVTEADLRQFCDLMDVDMNISFTFTDMNGTKTKIDNTGNISIIADDLS